MAMRTVRVVFLAVLVLPCLSGTTVSEAETEEVRVPPGSIMVLTPLLPSSFVGVNWGGGVGDSMTNEELADRWETEDEGPDEVEDKTDLLVLGEDGSGAEVVDTGSLSFLVVDIGSTAEEIGRGSGIISEPGAWGRGARFLIIVRFML